MKFSFLLTSKNEGEWLEHTVRQILRNLPDHGEVVVIDDGSTDNSTAFLENRVYPRLTFVRHPGLGVARARNKAALLANGTYLLFLDAHMNLPPNWWQPLVQQLQRTKVGAVQPCITDVLKEDSRGYGERFKGADLTLEWLPQRESSPYPIPILCGCCFAVRRNLFLQLGGLDGGMVGWGSEDCEFSLRLWRLGYQVVLVPNVEVAHRFRTTPPYDIDWSVVVHNRLRTAFAHFSTPRLERVLYALASLPSFDAAYAAATTSDIWTVRKWIDRHSIRTDDWLLTHSGLTF